MICNCSDLLAKMKTKKKTIYCRKMAEEIFEIKPYNLMLQLAAARDKFRLKIFMTRSVKMNFASNKQYAADLWSCP